MSQQCSPSGMSAEWQGMPFGRRLPKYCPSKGGSCATLPCYRLYHCTDQPYQGITYLGAFLLTELALVLPTGKVAIPVVFKTWCQSHCTRLSRWCHLCQWGPVFCTRSHIPYSGASA